MYLKKIFNTDNKINIAKNSAWLILDHGIRVLMGLLVGVWVARYLGPADYGKLNYVLALVGIWAPFYSLGLDSTVPKELINRQSEQEKILGAAFCLKFCGSLLILALSLGLILLFHYDNSTFILLAFFIGLSYIFKSFEVINIWFLNKLRSKFSVIARNTGLIASALFKVLLIIGGASIVYFGLAFTIEALIIATVLVLLFLKTESLFDFKKIEISVKQVFELLKKSWVYGLTGFSIVVNLNIDKIMIENMLGSELVGLYSISTFIVFSFGFIAVSVVNSSFATLIRLEKDKSLDYFLADFQKLHNYLALLAYAIIIMTLLTVEYFISSFLGAEYAFSAQIISVQVFILLFRFFRLFQGKWIVIKDLKKFLLLVSLTSVVMNTVLNYIFIKSYGVIGAAYSTVLTASIISLLSCLFNKETRFLFKMQLKAIFLVDIFRLIIIKFRKTEIR